MSNPKNECTGCCNHPGTVSSVHQTLSEMEFERGLWSAALNGETDRIESLISSCADVNAVDTSSYVPLHYGARNGHTDVCKKLISHGAKVNITTRSGSTPLHRAAYCGHTSTVKVLLEAGADVQLCDSDNQNALHKAAERGQFEVLSLLLTKDKSAQNMKDTRQRIPYDCLPSNVDLRIKNLFDQHTDR